MSNQPKNKSKKIKKTLSLARKDPLRTFDGLLQREDATTHKYHQKEYDVVKAGVMHAQQGGNERKKTWKPKDKPAVVSMAPASPVRAVVAFSRDHTPISMIKAGANATYTTNAVDLGVFREKKINTGQPWADTVMNGIPTGESRYPDPFTLAKTTQTVVSQTYRSLPVLTGTDPTTYAFSCWGALKGSPVHTFSVGIGADLTTTPYSIDWHDWDASAGMTWISGGLQSSDFYTRPNGVIIDIIPRLVGPAHSVKMYAVPMQPLTKSDYTAHPAGWPTDPNRGLTGLQVTWGGREWELDSTSKGVRLVTLPLDARCFDFLLGTSERTSISGAYAMSWTSWVWWITGLGAADSVDLVCNYCEECIIKNITTAAYAWPSTIRNTSTASRDSANSAIKKLAESGYTGVSFLDGTIDFAKKAWGVGSKLASVIGMLSPMFALAPTPEQYKPMLLKTSEEEKKEDDFLPVDRYERPLSALSSLSSSSNPKSLPSGGRKM